VISTIKQQQRLAKIVEELNQSNENSKTKKGGIEQMKAKLGESLKK